MNMNTIKAFRGHLFWQNVCANVAICDYDDHVHVMVSLIRTYMETDRWY